MARSIKKGPFIDKSIAKAVEKIRASGQRPPGDQDLVAAFDDHARHGWA